MTDEQRRELGIDADECPFCFSAAYYHYHGAEECPAQKTPTKWGAHMWTFEHPKIEAQLVLERARSAELLQAAKKYWLGSKSSLADAEAFGAIIAEYEATE